MSVLSRLKLNLSSRHRIHLEKFLKNISLEGEILDIGGAQNPVNNRILNKGASVKFKVLDLPKPHSHNDNVIDFKVDIQSQEFDVSNIKSKYTAIFCLEVSLYWHDPMQAIRNIVALMDKETRLYINFSQIFANQKPDSRDMFRYSFYWIQYVCKIYNLQIIETYPTQLTKVSKVLLNFMYKIEKMRKNNLYPYPNASSFLVVLELNNV
jgi:hypothetical protein